MVVPLLMFGVSLVLEGMYAVTLRCEETANSRIVCEQEEHIEQRTDSSVVHWGGDDLVLEKDKESYAGMAPEALESLAPEERRQVYRML